MKPFVVIFLLLAMSIGSFAYGDQSSSLMSNLVPSGIPGPATTSFSSLIPAGLAPSGFSLGKVTVNPFIQIGYQWNGVNMAVPVNVEFDPDPASQIAHVKIGTEDVVLKDYNFWMGTLGLNAIISPTLTLFGSATGLLPRSFTQIGQLPFSVGPLAFNSNQTMTGTNFESWTLQCGLSMGIGGGYSVLLGSLWQQTTMEYDDLRMNGAPRNPTARQDFMLNNWAPYIGFQILQPGSYRAALVYSPLLTSSGAINSRTTTPVLSNLYYNLNQPGYLVSVTGEYFLPLPPPASFSLWFTGATSVIKGSSDIEFTTPTNTRSGNVSTLSINQYTLSGGVTLGLEF